MSLEDKPLSLRGGVWGGVEERGLGRAGRKGIGDWGLEIGEWRVGSGEWRLESGEWRWKKPNELFRYCGKKFLYFTSPPAPSPGRRGGVHSDKHCRKTKGYSVTLYKII